ncbi:hypothetical protein IP78_13250 [Brevundimonas sp. AAP58]|uniref:tetratricopeptide repeat protein n=1 Tax=Brevundimonas sp. AAP58 TaxID=1523422 RepID=UPI0006B94547|nr:SEL1-like repeat protein [Brevundimonas sp. AAP58]KPF76491.1 hypothetical protein IP78_13250 [Brevundimonas sp. AAP58]
MVENGAYSEPSDLHRAAFERAWARLFSAEFEDAKREIEELACSGSILSMLFVADELRRGNWLYEEDIDLAKEWYELAIAEGASRGHYGLALAHLKNKDDDAAFREMNTAAQRGYPPAIGGLGRLYLWGRGVAPNIGLARYLWKKAAALGNLHAVELLIRLGIRWRFGFAGFLDALLMAWPYAWALVNVRADEPLSDHLR